MNPIPLAQRVVILLPIVFGGFGASSCVTSTMQSAGLRQVDDLLGQIERVHAETVLAKDKSHGVLLSLQTIADPDFSGDPVAGYAAFIEAVEQSEQQARALRASVEPMKSSADTVFERWAADLEAFQNSQMRARSQTRLEETRKLYDAIVTAVDPVQWSYDAYNATLRDHALFLGHDFNAASLSAIADGIDELADQYDDLEMRFTASEDAATEYVRSTALVGQIGVARPDSQAPKK